MTKRILVTGATDGIGLQTAATLAERGHHLILHGRNPQRLAAAQQQATRAGAASAHTIRADLGSLDQVRSAALTLLNQFDFIDVLINNAGVYMTERRLTEDGFEMTLGVNHLAPFVLTHALLPALKAAEQGRIVNVSSVAHTRGHLDRDDMNLEAGFDGYAAYARSKLCNVLFTRALHRRLAGTALTVNALHPGVIATKLLTEGFGMRSGRHDHDQGAATSIRLATDPDLSTVSGEYYSVNVRRSVARQARDHDAEEWLYQWSAEQTDTAPLPG